MNEKKAIIFDLEGVLIDTESLWDIETRTFLARREILYQREEIKHFLSGHSLPEATQFLKSHFSLEIPLDDLVTERFSIMAELIEKQVAFFENVEAFVTKLKPTYKIAVATAMDSQLLEIVNAKIGLAKLFDNHLFSVADVNGVSKDQPDLFQYVLSKLNVLPSEAFIVEDSPLPIVGAHKAGIEVIALATTYKAEKLTAADYVLEHFNELAKILH